MEVDGGWARRVNLELTKTHVKTLSTQMATSYLLSLFRLIYIFCNAMSGIVDGQSFLLVCCLAAVLVKAARHERHDAAILLLVLFMAGLSTCIIRALLGLNVRKVLSVCSGILWFTSLQLFCYLHSGEEAGVGIIGQAVTVGILITWNKSTIAVDIAIFVLVFQLSLATHTPFLWTLLLTALVFSLRSTFPELNPFDFSLITCSAGSIVWNVLEFLFNPSLSCYEALNQTLDSAYLNRGIQSKRSLLVIEIAMFFFMYSCIAYFFVSSLLKREGWNSQWISATLLICIGFPTVFITFKSLSQAVQTNFLFWTLNYFVREGEITFEGYVSMLWVLMIVVTLIIAPTIVGRWNQSKTIGRKSFHFLMCLMFLPVIRMIDVSFLSLAFGGALTCFVLVEIMRKNSIVKIELLEDYFSIFEDHVNSLTLSHISLLVGCALPIWLSEVLKTSSISTSFLLSLNCFTVSDDVESVVMQRSSSVDIPDVLPLIGIISVGFGDSLAAIFGSKYGIVRWGNSSRKTMLGSLSCFLGITMLIFVTKPDEFRWKGILQTVFLAISITLCETLASENDNILMPMVGSIFILLQDA